MPYSLLETLGKVPLVFVDVETTGASAELGDRVIEIGVARYAGGKLVGEYQQLVDPRRRIGPGVSALTGITQSMVEGQPTFSEQLDRLLSTMRGAGFVVGHNVRFDLSFLAREFRRCGVEMTEALENAPVLDTVRIARRRFGSGGNGLQRLCRRLGYEPDVAHRALPDAITTAVVFERLIAPVGGWNICCCDAMAQQGGPMALLPKDAQAARLPLELEEALEQRLPVLMEYLDANDRRTRRMIEPIEVRRHGGELTLIAHCQLRNDRRTFKVGRIVQLVRAGDTERLGDAGALR